MADKKTTTSPPNSSGHPGFRHFHTCLPIAPPSHASVRHSFHPSLMAQDSSSQIRPPGLYPSPNSYPSPSMSAYAYPPSNPSQPAEAYRASPTGSNVSLPSLNLPPIRTSMDTRPQSQQGQQHTPQHPPQHPPQQPLGQPQMVAALPPPMYYPAMPGQSLPPPQHMSVTSDPNQPMRYPLPPSDGRMMSGGRHKKEIKRRTKTGCLTCRKRRIKVRNKQNVASNALVGVFVGSM
ncbi:MAG: hypothetical protein Q9197_004688 [Variospora fuerteventurae]